MDGTSQSAPEGETKYTQSMMQKAGMCFRFVVRNVVSNVWAKHDADLVSNMLFCRSSF